MRFLPKKQATPEFQSLRNKILDEADRVIFDEAVRCLSAEALRAAHIMTWISVAESLKRKFTVMGQRDAEMGRILGKIKELERQDRPIDKFLLTKAQEFGVIADEEARKLEHVREMRNIYAHPSEAGPSKEEVVAALVISVNAVLSKPTLLRHGYVTGLMTSLFEDRHFLDDAPERIRDYAAGVARRIHPDVLPFFFQEGAERIEQVADDPESALYLRRGLEVGEAILDEVKPILSDEKWSIIGLIQRYPRACALLFSTRTAWQTLPDQARDMVLGNLVEPVKGTAILPPTSVGLRKARDLATAGLLTGRQLQRIRQATSRCSYGVLKEADVPLSEYAHRLTEDLSSHNWYIQNPAAEALRNVGAQQAALLGLETQEQLGRNVFQAADGTAVAAVTLILSIVRGTEVWPRAFVEGLLLEGLVNDDGKFRLKQRHLANALKIALAHSEATEIFRRICEQVSLSDPKWGWKTGEYSEAIAIVSTLRGEADPTVHPYLDALLEAIRTAESRAPAA